MTTVDQLAHVVAAAVLWWPTDARAELADWLATSDDEHIVALASVARHFVPLGPLLRPLPRYLA